MGRIKSALIKRTGHKLMEQPLEFKDNFSDNKKVLGMTMPSKRLRNMIAGFITKKVKISQKKKSA